MDRVEFKKSVRQGSLLRFETERIREGNTSVQYTVDVYRHDMKSGEEVMIFSTNTTFVCIDSQGKKCGFKG
jgi:acyl-CoA hydrolase